MDDRLLGRVTRNNFQSLHILGRYISAESLIYFTDLSSTSQPQNLTELPQPFYTATRSISFIMAMSLRVTTPSIPLFSNMEQSYYDSVVPNTEVPDHHLFKGFNAALCNAEKTSRIMDQTHNKRTINNRIFHNCRLINMNIKNSELYDCAIMRETQLTNCILFNCKVRNSRLNQVQAYGSTFRRVQHQNSDLTAKHGSLDSFPSEIRSNIFKNVVKLRGFKLKGFGWGGDYPYMRLCTSPNIVAALCVRPVLYQHVMEVFLDENRYRLCSNRTQCFNNMSTSVRKQIRRLNIDS